MTRHRDLFVIHFLRPKARSQYSDELVTIYREARYNSPLLDRCMYFVIFLFVFSYKKINVLALGTIVNQVSLTALKKQS